MHTHTHARTHTHTCTHVRMHVRVRAHIHRHKIGCFAVSHNTKTVRSVTVVFKGNSQLRRCLLSAADRGDQTMFRIEDFKKIIL